MVLYFLLVYLIYKLDIFKTLNKLFILRFEIVNYIELYKNYLGTKIFNRILKFIT